MTQRTPSFFLVQRETSDRFSIRRPMILGGAQADIPFTEDAKISNQHCKVTPTPEGLLVEDLGSSTGTYVDSIRVKVSAPICMQAGSELRIGQQTFSLQAIANLPTSPTTQSREQKKSPRLSLPSIAAIGATLLTVFAIVMFVPTKHKLEKPVRPLIAQNQTIHEIFKSYQEILRSMQRQTASTEQLNERIQIQVLDRIKLLSLRPEPVPQDTAEQPIVATMRKYILTLKEHAKAQRLFLQNGEYVQQLALDRWQENLSELSEDFRSHMDPRLTPAPTLPVLIESPLQMVEHQMRKTLRACHTKSAVHRDLLPEFTNVGAALEALKGDSDVERKRIATERELIAAYIQQIKAIDLYEISQDQRYSSQSVKWTGEIERLSGALKLPVESARHPASVIPQPVPLSDGP